jgi:hypothetical protein
MSPLAKLVWCPEVYLRLQTMVAVELRTKSLCPGHDSVDQFILDVGIHRSNGAVDGRGKEESLWGWVGCAKVESDCFPQDCLLHADQAKLAL